MAPRSFSSSSILVTVQNNVNKESASASGSGLHGSKVRSLANLPTADLEDGEITEEEKSASRSTDTTPTPRIGLPAEHSLTPLALGGSDGTWAKAVEICSQPENTELLIPDLVGPQPLILSDEDLDHAKSIVLDLLGWGVEPEYLIEYGVSSQAIYRIFTDLHLRLPANLSHAGEKMSFPKQ